MDECLVRWTDSFMRDRRVIMSLDGQDGEEMAVTTGLPKGSPVSPVLFAIYITDIHQAVESQVEDSRGISFVDDVTWVVTPLRSASMMEHSNNPNGDYTHDGTARILA